MNGTVLLGEGREERGNKRRVPGKGEGEKEGSLKEVLSKGEEHLEER